MRHASPLRYPGGKATLAGTLKDIRRLNGLGGHATAEPFAGGAGAALTLLYLEETPSIHINDADPALYAFWRAATQHCGDFLQRMAEAPVNVQEWRRQKDKLSPSDEVSDLERGFAAFYVNRCNRSGIIRGGSVIGGIEQRGVWKIDARFNKETLRHRLERLDEYRFRIAVSGMDGIDFVDSLEGTSTFLFIDPPYFHKGPMLYLNSLDSAYHERLAARLRSLEASAWVLTYDDCHEVRAMYEDWANIRPYSLHYSARQAREGRELLITPRWMHLPEERHSLPAPA